MRYLVLFLAALGAAIDVHAQAPPGQAPVSQPASAQPGPPSTGQIPTLPTTICGADIPEPARLPPAGSQPVVYLIYPCFQRQGGSPVVEAQTYLYYIEMAKPGRVSQPSQNRWVAYDEGVERIILDDFKRLWATKWLDDLLIDVRDVRFSNGVVGKVVVYDMEERQRVKIVDFVGSEKVDRSKIDEELKKKSLNIQLDSFIDPGLLRNVAGVVRTLYGEKGYQYAEVKPEITPIEGGPKLVNVSFHITEGPKVKIRKLDFVGNNAVSDGKLAKRMKENKGKSFWFGWILGSGTFKEEKFDEDADRILEYYRDRGYIAARVGQPDLKILEDSKDAKTRWVELKVPITEGNQYRIGNFDFDGNKIVRSDALRTLYKMKSGDVYSEKLIRKGLEKSKEVYGSGGYYEFNGYPDLSPRDQAPPPEDGAGPPAPAPEAKKDGPPIVDVTMRIQEGKQYFINRITFTGNTTTRDNVIRREMRVLESGVFNTEALKASVKRLNQLGYFKPLEGEAIGVEKTPNVDNKVDIRLKFEEQNRNQLTFGAGVSQYDGFFGQLSFQTSNFLGRGETFTVSAQQGSRAKNYQLAFTEPFLFDRPQTAGVDLFIREIDYIGLYTQRSSGGNVMYGFQVQDYARMFVTYSLERVQVLNLNTAFNDPRVLQGNPFLAESLLLGQGGRRIISKVTPSYVYNTVDHPIFPTSGTRYSLSLDIAGIGGNTNFLNPMGEAIWYKRLNTRTSAGLRLQGQYVTPWGSTQVLPIFEKIFLGGEYSIRGFDIRSIGPRDATSGVVIGGNKSILANAEYLINIAGPVRLVLFADAGQVRDKGESFGWKEDYYRLEYPAPVGPPEIVDPFQVTTLYPGTTPPAIVLPTRVKIGEVDAFKTSVGAEIRFFMPVLNVPFRLIFAANPSRGGVLNNNLEPEEKWKFRFAVGSTF
jgi:outer membrane protein insertion porin family